MNDYVAALLLGIVEGLTEFLPVSSTAHLRIVEAGMGIDLASGYWKMFSIVIQLGAILVLPVYFWARIRRFLGTFPAGETGDRNPVSHPVGLTAIAFVMTAVPAFLLTRVIGKNLESLWVMAASLVLGGAVMWAVDAFYDRGVPRLSTQRMDEMGVGQALWIGACQVLSAVFPGTSRSMATIAAGQVAGMSRTAALEFSFFLSMPTMGAAVAYDLLKSLRHGEASGIGAAPVDAHGWTVLTLGFVVSFIVAYAVVAWFMRWVRTRGFVPFAVYRIVLGFALIAWLLRQ